MSENQEIQSALEQLQDDDEDIRSQAALSLGWMGEDEVVNPLIYTLRNDTSAKVRANAAMALGQLGVEEAIDVLINALNDKDHNVRGVSAYSLGLLKTSDAVESLIDLILKDPDKEARLAAIDALIEIGDKRAIEPLLEMSVKEKNKDLQSSAQTALEKICLLNEVKNVDDLIKKKKEQYKKEEELHKEQEKDKIISDLKQKELEKYRAEKVPILIEKLPNVLDFAIHEEPIPYDKICQQYACDSITLELALSELARGKYDIVINSVNKTFSVLKPHHQLSDDAKEKIRLLRRKMGMNW